MPFQKQLERHFLSFDIRHLLSPKLLPDGTERIRKIRKEEGLSLELFALRCDMNAAYVGHIERGVQNPTLNTLERICKGLDISVEDLFIDKSATVDMNTAALQYFSQITRDLSPEQFHRLLNIIKEIVAVMK